MAVSDARNGGPPGTLTFYDLQTRVVLMLCRMEMIFPPSFFTSQVHLIVHLVEEAKMGGSVHYCWMYPIERYSN